MILPDDKRTLTRWALNIIDRCDVSMGARANAAKEEQTWLYTGSPDGKGAILNMLNPHLKRTASYIYSPADLRLNIDYGHRYPKETRDKGEIAGRILTREFRRRDIDMQFGQSVGMAMTHGSAITKLLDSSGGMTCNIVAPWHFGVYREDRESLSEQEACDELNFITPFDLWRRISHLPNAQTLFKRAMTHARSKSGGSQERAPFNQVLISGMNPAVQTDPPFMNAPGGLVAIYTNSNGVQLSPDVEQELIGFHELWVWDDEREDWTTIQLIEPDILISPLYRRKNLFIPGELPYGVTCANKVPGYFFGRSEMADLMKLQHLLKDRLDDIKKIMSLQYDRLLGFVGNEAIGDEQYDAFKQAGYINLGPAGDIKDITPKIPPEAFQDVNEIINLINMVSGFNNILSGQGEQGVRAAEHAQTLMKTASPSLRDRALIVERQCGDLGHKVFEGMIAKDATAYWSDDDGEKEFLLSDLPDDYDIGVDSHSSSPIYEQQHEQVAFGLAKLEAIGAEDLINLLPLPHRDILVEHARDREKAQAAFMQQHPELLGAAASKGKKK